jgi:hypothetical protein
MRNGTMRNLMIALTLTLCSLAAPVFTLVACADAEVSSRKATTVELPVESQEVKSIAVRHDPNLGDVKITVYKSQEVNL